VAKVVYFGEPGFFLCGDSAQIGMAVAASGSTCKDRFFAERASGHFLRESHDQLIGHEQVRSQDKNRDT